MNAQELRYVAQDHSANPNVLLGEDQHPGRSTGCPASEDIRAVLRARRACPASTPAGPLFRHAGRSQPEECRCPHRHAHEAHKMSSSAAEMCARSNYGSSTPSKQPKNPLPGKLLSFRGKSLSFNDKGLSCLEGKRKGFVGAPGRTRTCNILIRSQRACDQKGP